MRTRCGGRLASRLTREQIDMIAILSRASEHHTMRVKRRGRDRGGAGTVQETGVRLEGIEEGAIDVEEIDIVALGSRGEDGGVLVHGQRAQRVLGRPDRPQRLVLADVPELDLAVAAAADQLAQAAALHVHVGDPLLVVAPAFDHGLLGAEALVEDADGAVAVAAYEDVACDLVRGEGCDAGTGAGGNVLGNISRVSM